MDCSGLQTTFAGTGEGAGLEKEFQIVLSAAYELLSQTTERPFQVKSSSFMTTKSRLKRFIEENPICRSDWGSLDPGKIFQLRQCDYTHYYRHRRRMASFVLTVQETNTRHYAVNCTELFLSVVEAWGIEQKVTTIRTDCDMMAAARQLLFHQFILVCFLSVRFIPYKLLCSFIKSLLWTCVACVL